MYNDIIYKIKNLKRKKTIFEILFIALWFMSFQISSNAYEFIIPMQQVIITLISDFLNIQEFYKDTFLSMLNFFYRNLSLIVYITGRIKLSKTNKEIHDLQTELIIKIDNQMKKQNTQNVISDENLWKIYNIIIRFEELPRNKQMEVLNYIKGDLTNSQNELSNDIKELNSTCIEFLQSECVDILFPDFDEFEEDYSKKLKK